MNSLVHLFSSASTVFASRSTVSTGDVEVMLNRQKVRSGLGTSNAKAFLGSLSTKNVNATDLESAARECER